MILAVDILALQILGDKNKKRPVYLAFFYVLVGSIVISCTPKEKSREDFLLRINGETMGTTYSIKAVAPGLFQADKNSLAQEIGRALVSYNQVMSTYVENSEVSLLNQAPVGEWIKISKTMRGILTLSQHVSQKSNGAFDITVGPLVNLWGFGPKQRDALPAKDEIELAKTVVGYQHIVVSDSGFKKLRSLYLDFSAVAKGHATDMVARLLESKQIVDYMVEIGGELKIRGRNHKGKTWTIGIEKPMLNRDGVVQAVTGDNIAIATSGEYRNYYENGGVRVSHTVDPLTGYPVKHRLASVTVVTETAALADAFATAINVLGPKAGYELAVKEGLAVLLIENESEGYRVKYTSDFEQYMVR